MTEVKAKVQCKDCKFFIEYGEQTACKKTEDPHFRCIYTIQAGRTSVAEGSRSEDDI